MDEQIKEASTVEKLFSGALQTPLAATCCTTARRNALSFMLGWFLLKTSRLSSSEVAIIQSC